MAEVRTNVVGRKFVYLWLAQSISLFGDAFLEITLPVWVGLVTKSPVQVAGVAAAELLPSLIVGPFTGVLAERFNPKSIMVITDLGRTLVVLILLAFHGPSTTYLAYIVSFLLSLGTRIFVPSQTVLLRTIIKGREVPKAQGLFSIASSISLALGPALGGTLLLTVGPQSAVILDSITFVVSMLLILSIHQAKGQDLANVHPNKSTELRMFVRDATQGLRFLLSSNRLVLAMVATAVCTLVGFIWFTVDLFYVKSYLHAPGAFVGYLWTASGFGDLLAGLVIVLWLSKIKSVWTLFGGICLRATMLIGYSLIGQFSFALPLCFFAGMGDCLVSTAASTIAMEQSPSHMLGRISSILDMVGQLSGISATVLIATIGSKLSSQQDLLACSVLLLLAGSYTLHHLYAGKNGSN